jgi:solute:Na+ symporter, SSS family
VSLVDKKGMDDEKGITLSKKLFRTGSTFNIGAFTVMVILVALYAVFWK